jgi:hypothetical protein
MDARQIVVDAMKAIDDAEVPSDLRSTAFAKVMDLLSSGNGRPGERSGSPSAGFVPREQASTEQDLLGRIAGKLGVDHAIVAEVYEEADTEVRVVVAPKRLDKSKMAATKVMSLLVAGGRQAAGLEETTAFEKIREAAEDYGIYDQNNFARTITDMGDDFIISGSKRSRTVRLRSPAWEKLKDHVSRLGGDES